MQRDSLQSYAAAQSQNANAEAVNASSSDSSWNYSVQTTPGKKQLKAAHMNYYILIKINLEEI